MSFKSTITKESEKQIKAKHKKENTMKKAVITTVAITLLAIGILGGMFYLGMTYNQSINDRVHLEAKALTASVQPAPSKQ